MKKRLVGVVDGRPHYNFEIEDSDLDADGQFHLVHTGVGRGVVALADGTSYDVSEPVIAVASEAHRTEVAHHIAVQAEASGQLDAVDEATGKVYVYEHTDCDHCDAPKTDDTDPLSPQAREQMAGLAATLSPEGAV